MNAYRGRTNFYFYGIPLPTPPRGQPGASAPISPTNLNHHYIFIVISLCRWSGRRIRSLWLTGLLGKNWCDHTIWNLVDRNHSLISDVYFGDYSAINVYGKNLHTNAKRGSGGQLLLFSQFVNISMLESVCDHFLVIEVSSKNNICQKK